jgi:hypothetical protein
MYYQVDDIPTHTAPKGSVAIMTSGTSWDNGFTFVNNDGGTTWLKCISQSYGVMSLTGADAAGDAQDPNGEVTTNFVTYNSTLVGATWVLGNSTNDWILATENGTADDLKYTGSTPMRVIASVGATVRSGTSKWVSHNITTAQNFTVITESVSQYYTGSNSSDANCGHNTIREVVTNDYFLLARNFVAYDTAGGGGPATREYFPKDGIVGVIKIDEPYIKETEVLNEGFESSGFTANSWTVTNNTTNVWVVGQAENNGGTSSAYISDDGGTSASYTITTANVSHFYKDFTFPANNIITLTFDWKCQGENAGGATQYDYGAVVIAPTGTTPVAGSEVVTTQTAGAATTRLGATTNAGKFNLNYGTTPGTTWNSETIDLSDYAGESKRLVFTWKNDGSVGTDPPFILDNIKITTSEIQY